MGSLRSNDYFSRDPRVHIRRSRFDKSHPHKATFNNGSLIPIYVDSVIAGDTVDAKLTSVVRMSTPVKPIMDNLFMDTFWFFVPYRLVWSHWEEFFGANRSGYWSPAVEYQEPHINYPTSTSAAHLGRALSRDEWYAQGGGVYTYDDSGVEKIVSMPKLLYKMFQRGCLAKYFDYGGFGVIDWFNIGYLSWDAFAAQYSESDLNDGLYGVYGQGWSIGSLADYMGDPVYSSNGSVSALKYRAYCLIYNTYFRDQSYMNPVNYDRDVDSDINGLDWQSADGISYDRVTDTVKGAKPLQVCRFHDYFSSCLPQPQKGDAVRIPLSGIAPIIDMGGSSDYLTPLKVYTVNGYLAHNHRILDTGAGSGVTYDVESSGGSDSVLAHLSQGADLSKVVGQSTINDLRTAFQLQKFEETFARAGGLYKTILQAFFGVDNNDARLQMPEYLGGSRHFLNVTQVLQTSSTDETTPQGNTAAYSLTVEKEPTVCKSFTEPGVIMCLCATRTSRSYQNGQNRLWTKRRKYDHYWPQFAHLGEQSVLLKELYNRYDSTYAKEDSDLESVFGFQERYAEYRYFPATVSGDFRSDSPQSLDFWHFADDYIDAPIMSEGWLLEGPENLDRCLAVTSKLSHQFIGDFYFDMTWTRPMPLYSIPGLADHF